MCFCADQSEETIIPTRSGHYSAVTALLRPFTVGAVIRFSGLPQFGGISPLGCLARSTSGGLGFPMLRRGRFDQSR